MLIDNHWDHHQIPYQAHSTLLTSPPPTSWNQMHHQSSSSPPQLIAVLTPAHLTATPHHVASQQKNGWLISWQFNMTFIDANLNLTICSNAGQYLTTMVDQLSWLPQLPYLCWCHMTSHLSSNQSSVQCKQIFMDSLHLAQHTVHQHNQKLYNLLPVMANMSTQLNGLLFGLQAIDLRLTAWHSAQLIQPQLPSAPPKFGL